MKIRKYIFGLIAIIIAGLYSPSDAKERIPVPSDLHAKYFLISREGTKDKPIITTMRVGTSGTSYSKRIFDCVRGTGKYLGDGDTIEQMNASKPQPYMYEMTAYSISYYVYKYACQ